MRERQPNPEQEKAIVFEGGNLLVSAAAGSGKTSTLTARVLRKILDPGNPIDIDRMLIVTFTRAAAADMKNKISTALSENKTPRAARQQMLLPMAQICTIDAFGLWLIRQYGAAIGLPVNISLSPEERVRLLEDDVLSAFIAEKFESGGEDFLKFAGTVAEKDSSKLFGVIKGLSDFLQPLPNPAFFLQKQLEKCAPENDFYPEQAVCAVREKARALAEKCREFIPFINEKYRDYVVQLAESAEAASDYADLYDLKFKKLPNGCKSPENPSAPLFSVLGRYKDAVTELKTDLLTTPPEKLAAENAAVRAHLSVLFDLTMGYLQKCAEVKKEREVFGYADITRFCADLLFKTDESGLPIPTELAGQVSEKFDEIMIDEFQDINELQFAVFNAISRGGNLFMVGDMKQSIYRFRNATPQVFGRVCERSGPPETGEKDVLIPLTKNYRSESAVIDAVNFVFSQLMHGSAEIEYDRDQRLVCRYDDKADMGLVKFCPVQTGAETDPASAEADAIAAQIRTLAENGIQTSDGLFFPKLSDICVLSSKNDYCKRISERLTRQGLANYCMTEPDFFDLPEVKPLLHVLWATDNPLNDLALLSAALSPVWHLSADELGTIRAEYREKTLFSSMERASQSDAPYAEKCKKMLDDLDLLRRYSAILPLGELISCAVERTGFEATAAAMGTAGGKNIAQLIRYAADWDARGVDLSAFNALVADAIANGRKVESGGAIPADAVTICTIHKSKGLEFPVCFLAGTVGTFNFQSKTPGLAADLDAGISAVIPTSDGAGRYKPLAYKVIGRASRQKSLAEDLRLLYVAMTRAKTALIITSASQNPADMIAKIAEKVDGADGGEIFDNGKSFAEWLIPAFLHHPSCDALRESAGVDFELINTPGTVQAEFITPEKMRPQTLSQTAEAEPDPVLVQKLTERLNNTYKYAPLTELSSKYTVTELAEGRDDDELTVPRFVAGESGTSYGTEMHAFMQMCDLKAKDAKAEADKLYRAGKLSKRALEMLNFDAVNKFLTSSLCAEFTAENVTVEREFDFISTIPLSKVKSTAPEFADEPVILQGCADLIGVRSGNGLILVDYKTDALTDPAQFLTRYKAQLDLYAEALSRIFGLPVLKKSIWSFKLGREIKVPD
ncbi:MAG TPA: UvrD-helicase domain-containing protein [Oscillospiraceae bacterium]|nr:UvrD-helicase domain-containing protein [Oscillospiraceae bacterium]HPF55422.1 UvrD-helicase domain-containing protein [Clostridiales bacterium]HPK34458.1 UvrD-helicase domain-containing protein [Oscillospiraceae bacterium]HPR76438.1 UvrD-helicase domain-containing protein [Oscillospiraceae bacterium]